MMPRLFRPLTTKQEQAVFFPPLFINGEDSYTGMWSFPFSKHEASDLHQNLHLSHTCPQNSLLTAVWFVKRKRATKKPQNTFALSRLTSTVFEIHPQLSVERKQPLIKSDFLWVECKWRFICRKVGWRKLVYFVSIMTVFCKKCLFAPLCYQKAHNHSRNTHAITVVGKTQWTRTQDGIQTQWNDEESHKLTENRGRANCR